MNRWPKPTYSEIIGSLMALGALSLLAFSVVAGRENNEAVVGLVGAAVGYYLRGKVETAK